MRSSSSELTNSESGGSSIYKGHAHRPYWSATEIGVDGPYFTGSGANAITPEGRTGSEEVSQPREVGC
ncbi:hypothetical protein V6N13_088831 [Hibiscus sabdariffa]